MQRFQLSKADSQKVMAAIKRTQQPATALMAAVATYNEALGPLRELIRAIETEWQAAWDARSERWQEGIVGQSVAEIITAWGTLARHGQYPSFGSSRLGIGRRRTADPDEARTSASCG